MVTRIYNVQIVCPNCSRPVKSTEQAFMQLGEAYVDWWRCAGCSRIITEVDANVFHIEIIASALKTFQQL